MATVTGWNPFGVSLNVTATGSNVVRKSATQYTVKISASWASYYNSAKTNYGMTASSGGGSVTINPFGTKASSGSGTFTGTYSISGNGAATKTITVTFRNFNSDNGNSATVNVTFNVSVPAWTSYKVSYNANGGSGAPSAQTKWKDQALTLSGTKPTRTGYSFQGWGTSTSDTSVDYAAGAKYTANSAITLYAIWKADTYTVSYNANGGSGAPSSQTKTYGVALTLSSVVPTRANYNFLGWATSSNSTTAVYNAGGSYTNNAALVLYAVWELAYVKPRINNFTVTRCNYDDIGTPVYTDDGIYVSVIFEWESDYEIKDGEERGIQVYWKRDSDKEWLNDGYVVQPYSGTSGYFELLIDGYMQDNVLHYFGTDATWNFKVIVSDEVDSSYAVATLPGNAFPIDILAGGKGIAFNKPAELEGVMDVNFQLKTTAGLLYPVLNVGTDLNELLIPNKYILQNVKDSAYVCGENSIPITSGTGMLTIESFGPEGQVKQTIEVCHKNNPLRFERYYYQSEWGDWHEAGGYKSAMTVGLNDNVTLGAVNTYTLIPFNKSVGSKGGSLSLSDGYAKIGTGIQRVMISGQLKINCGSITGNRHARLCKNSGGTISHLAWTHMNVRSASDTILLVFTPILTSVKEGDLIYAVFYTPDSTDVNYMGSSANGNQTYMTVESI